jgi:hypothetical protein
MTRPPVHTHVRRTVGALLLLANLLILAGCQGLSAGNSSTQTPGQLDFVATSLNFGFVKMGTTQTLSIAATNSGSQTVNISSVAITTNNFVLTAPSLPATVAAGQTVLFTVAFTPDTFGTFNAGATVTTDATDATTILTLTGTGTTTEQLAVSGATGDFGSVTVGGQQSQTVTLTNTGVTTVNISQAAAIGSEFQMSGLATPLSLNPGQNTTFTISFAPTATGDASGALAIASDATNSLLKMGLTGTGVLTGALGSSAGSLSFGTVPVGSKQSQSETLTNTGSSSITISQTAVAGSGFGMSGLTAPMTLAAGQSVSFTASFQPTATGAATGSITIASSASNSVVTINLSGTGSPAGTLTPNPASLNFGSVAVGVKQTLSETVTNSGGSTVTISQAAVSSGSGFTMSGLTVPLTLTVGQSATFSVSFQPAASGAATGTVTLTSDSSNPTLTIPLSGTGAASGPITASPTSLSFGNVQVGVNKTISETVTNAGGSSVTISQVAISGGSGFSVSGITAPVTLAGGQSATFNVSFLPAATGAVSGSLTITSDGLNPTLTIPMSGTGIAAGTLGSNPTSLAFGSIQVGNSKTLSETVTNTGGTSITISQVGVSGAGFSASGINAPVTLAAGQSASFSVLFTPTNAGAVSGDVTITSTASNPTLDIPLTGTGIAAGALGSNPTSLAFGSVQVSSNKTLSETVTNTGGTSVTISQVGVSGPGFSVSGISTPVTLAAGQSAAFSVLFSPTAAGAVSGNVAITSDASNPTLNIALTGTGIAAGALGSNPTSLAFGSVQVGSSKTLSETVTNTGGSAVTISQVAVTGPGFSVSAIGSPVTLTAGQSTTFSVLFTPTAAGAVSGNVAVTSNASNPTLNIPLTATGTASAGALVANPTSLAFGSVAVGGTQSLSETVTNSGATSITISQVTISGSAFTLSGISAPVTLTAGQSATFSVSFAPTAAGAVSGNVAITSTASNPSLNIPLSGTGVASGALGSNPTSLAFGNVQIAHTNTLSETVTNTGSTSISISQVAVSGTGFSVSGISAPVTLTAGQSATFSVSFTPLTGGAKSGNVTVTSNASNPTLNIALTGTGTSPGTLVSNPTTLSFGNVPVSTTQSLSETLTNVGGASSTISSLTASGAGFSLSGISVPITLTPGQSATFSVSFTPASAGAVNGDVTIISNASDSTFVVPLSGTGTGGAAGQLTVAPTTLALGSVTVGSSGTATGTLTASGASVTVTGAGSSSGAFSLSGLSLPVTIAAGQSASFTVTFSPQTTGAASGTLTFTSNAQPTTTTESLTGTGTAAVTHSVDLSWNASTTTDVNGYNIYRAVYTTSCGSFSKINSTLNASMSYTDPAVSSGTSYCYAATAVDSNNAESGYSNIVSNLQIP